MMVHFFFTLTFHLTILHHDTKCIYDLEVLNTFLVAFFCGCTVHNMGVSLVYNFSDTCASVQIYVCYTEQEVSVNICPDVIWRMKVFQSKIK